MPDVSPRLSTPADDATKSRLSQAAMAARRADAVLREEVIAASMAGVSVREIATHAEISTNTVQRWKQDRPLRVLELLDDHSPMTSTEADTLRVYNRQGRF